MLPIYEIFIEDSDHIAIALVDAPAIESDFIFFNSEEPIKMVFNDEKMIVKGPALIPRKLMYKNSPQFGERYVFYSEETIFKFVELLMSKKENKFNLLHTNNYIKANIIESYFAQEPNEFGVPKNSWIVSAKINDVEVWDKIKSGELHGFSVEGMFSSELVEFSESLNEKTKNNMNELKEKIISAINNILFDEKPTEDAPVAEEVKEEFVAVENQVVEEVVEEIIMESEVTDDVLTIASVNSLLEQMKVSLMEELNSQMGTMVESMKKELTFVKQRVEEFSNQPISESITEEVANPKITNVNKAAKFFVK